MSTYLKHVEIQKFKATKKCDISFDSPSKNQSTMEFPNLFLLPFSRNEEKKGYLTVNYVEYKINSFDNIFIIRWRNIIIKFMLLFIYVAYDQIYQEFSFHSI